MEEIKDLNFDEERSLYNIKDTLVNNCHFEGPKDGESVLKETRNVIVKSSTFSLRYPLWHARKFEMIDSTMDDNTRAPIWYSNDGIIKGCSIKGIKCLRECQNISIDNSNVISKEFGWKCNKMSITNSEIDSEYFLFETDNVKIDNLKMKGKYSFQYMHDVVIKNSILDTKDAFWHSKNVTVYNSTLKGEYLAWFSDTLTLINCKIIGTQPLCYCKNLKLIDCTMEDTDLAFEYSEVEASIKGNILSVKNPLSGIIEADSITEIIKEKPVYECSCKIVIR